MQIGVAGLTGQSVKGNVDGVSNKETGHEINNKDKDDNINNDKNIQNTMDKEETRMAHVMWMRNLVRKQRIW